MTRRTWDVHHYPQTGTPESAAVLDVHWHHSSLGETITPIFKALRTEDARIISWELKAPKSCGRLRFIGYYETVEQAKRAARERRR